MRLEGCLLSVCLVMPLTLVCTGCRSSQPAPVRDGVTSEGGALTAEEDRRVDEVIGEYVSATRGRIIAEADLEHNIELLKRGGTGWDSWQSPMRIGWCAKSCRDAFVPVPASIDDSVVDAIVPLAGNTVGIDEANRRYIRQEVARALSFIGDKRALGTVLNILETEGGHFAWQGLPEIADPAMIPIIERKLDFTNQQDALPAIAALERIGRAAIPLLERLTQSTDRALRRRAVDALSAIQSVDGLPALDALSDDPDLDIRRKAQAAARIIRSREIDRVYRPPRINPETKRKLHCLTKVAYPSDAAGAWDRMDPAVRAVFISLGPKAIPVLRELLGSYGHVDGPGGPDYFVTNEVAEILAEIGRPSVPALIDALNDEMSHVHAPAAEALQRLTGEDFGIDYDAWRDWSKTVAEDRGA